MIKEIQATGKSVEQAIQNALLELKVPRDDVDIKILDQGGLFKKAKVLVAISEDCIAKYEEKEAKRKELLKSEEKEVAEQKDQKVELEEKEVKEVKNEKQEKSDNENLREFLEGFLKALNNNSTVSIKETENELFASINGENSGSLIGYRGDGINAIQYLATVYVSKHNRHSKKVRLDIEDYRARREETLIALAERIARKVQKTKHSCKLEPMTANERRIIHTTVQNFENLTTFSKGEEPNRYLTIAYNHGDTKTEE
ncbi:MAG: protein jag [Clostridia bacterium]|nr:protein jag [Clostridia bacterium]